MDSHDFTLPQLLEQQVAKTPQAIAVIYENQQITYAELDQRANQVAHFLAAKGIGKGVPVGLLLDRSIEMVIAIWGLLKAGGSYVPLDTALPESRFAHIAEETGIPLLLTNRNLAGRLPSHVSAMTWEDAQPHIDRESTAAIASPDGRPEDNRPEDNRPEDNRPEDNAAGDAGPEDVAYIVYTSGSTGKPKGVLIPHRVFTRCQFWATEVFGFTRHDRFLLNFFRAPEELFYPHLIGATLVLSPPDAERDMRLLSEVVAKHQINVLGLTPSLLRAFLDEYPSGNDDPLKHVYCAGEALPLNFQQHFFSKSKANLYNFYGLSEAPYTSIWKCQPDDTRPILPIGRPVDAKVLILDAQRKPVIGKSIGELFIGGPGLALGYLNQPELTASKFLEHEGERFYCTLPNHLSRTVRSPSANPRSSRRTGRDRSGTATASGRTRSRCRTKGRTASRLSQARPRYGYRRAYLAGCHAAHLARLHAAFGLRHPDGHAAVHDRQDRSQGTA